MIFAFDAACGTCGRTLKTVHVKLPLKLSSQATVTPTLNSCSHCGGRGAIITQIMDAEVPGNGR